MSKKLAVAGMYLWDVQIEFNNYLNSKGHRTLIVATRRHRLSDAQKKATSYLKAHRSEYPKAQVTGIQNGGCIDA